ncbi:hypothetical protein GCM10023189_42330 [Nibrella saemangeumensis]|uniref:Alpha/beta hydrolase n=1 Tax=Nibrella saemangeumensis TaxID=1084526 RepID=A0ABP8NAA8_9BACT
MRRYILIHGYVEDPTIFDPLVPHLPPGETLRLSLKDEFAEWKPQEPINALSLARYLSGKYCITDQDVVIGHSMGGWIAIQIKSLNGATVVQIGSYTNQLKVTFPVKNIRLLKWMAKLGMGQSALFVNWVKKTYPFDETRALYTALLEGMRKMDRTYIYQQLLVLFAPVPPLTVTPDLRIHNCRDNIVAAPDEPYVDVPGDHFCLVFHPETVAVPIRSLLEQKQTALHTSNH